MALENDTPHAEQSAAHEVDLAGVDPAAILHTTEELARENPHAVLAAAFGVGFLLGGGLTPRLLASIALFAGKRYLAQAARGALESTVRQQIDAATAS